MSKISKIIVLLGIIFLLTSMFYVVTAATTIINPNTYKPDDPNGTDSTELTKRTGVILGLVRNIGAVVSVIALMIIGLKYMLGSVEEKANYKKSMMPYIIGCVLLLAGTSLISFIYDAIH